MAQTRRWFSKSWEPVVLGVTLVLAVVPCVVVVVCGANNAWERSRTPTDQALAALRSEGYAPVSVQAARPGDCYDVGASVTCFQSFETVDELLDQPIDLAAVRSAQLGLSVMRVYDAPQEEADKIVVAVLGW